MDHRPTNFFEAGKALDLDADVKSSSNEDTLMLAASASSATYTDGKLVDLSTLGPILLNADGTYECVTSTGICNDSARKFRANVKNISAFHCVH